MVNEEILGGLKSALERGSSLEKAMLTLFNSGYKREEIEEAARDLLEFKPEAQIQPSIKTAPKTAEIKPTPQALTKPITKTFPELKPPVRKPIQIQPAQLERPIFAPQVQIQKPAPIQVQKPVQKVSVYEKPQPKPRGGREKIIIIVLVFLLIFLVGALGAIFVFRQQLIDFLSSFFA